MPKSLSLLDRVIPMQHPRVLIETAREQGAKTEALLANTGIDQASLSDPEARISYLSLGALVVNAIAQTGNFALGFDFGRRIHLSHLGIVGLAVLSSGTAEEALRTGLRFGPLFMPVWDITLNIEGDKAVLAANAVFPLGELRPFATETLLAAFSGLAAFVLGEHSRVHEIRLDYAAPAHGAQYTTQMGAPVLFSQPALEAVIDATMLRRPLTSADPLTRELAQRYCEVELAKLPSRQDLVRCVRLLLALRPGQYADLNAVAYAMRTSTRSLRRELGCLGTSYQALLDEVRREHVLNALRATTAPTEELAAELGFSDARSLRRAVKRWTGLSPQELRPPDNARSKRR